jgi:hypothetical protein
MTRSVRQIPIDSRARVQLMNAHEFIVRWSIWRVVDFAVRWNAGREVLHQVCTYITRATPSLFAIAKFGLINVLADLVLE